MKFLKKLFTKTPEKENNIYSEMGSLGVSSAHMLMYQNSINKMKEYENKSNSKVNHNE